MSRDILFRGKRKDNGEWVEGFLIKVECIDNKKLPKKTVIFPVNAECNWFNGFIFGKKEVITETVGQFTGLTDKNGKKIFEGDIVYVDGDGENYVVVFENGAFCIKKESYNVYILDGEYGIIPSSHEVIGNIYDNPELLGEDK